MVSAAVKRRKAGAPPTWRAAAQAAMTRLRLSALRLPHFAGRIFLSVVVSKPRTHERRENAFLLPSRAFVPDAVQRVAMHRRSGTFANASVCNDPGSAAHHFVLRCARETSNSSICAFCSLRTTCPGRGAARSGAPQSRDLRKLGIVHNDPGSAAHHCVLRCAREMKTGCEIATAAGLYDLK